MNHSAEAPPLAFLEGAALFLDFDGTLVELADLPDAIEVPQELHPLIARLAERLGGRVAIVSGRAVGDLERHLGKLELVMSGSHGLEMRLADGRSLPVAVPPGLAEARAQIARYAAKADGLLLEEKPASIALHYRLAPEREEGVLAFLSELAARTGLSVQPGKMVAELRPRGSNKGDALRTLMREPPFAGARPLFVGDDLTDEDAFAAAAELGGEGILVGPPRETKARWRLGGVAEVSRWLEAAARG